MKKINIPITSCDFNYICRTDGKSVTFVNPFSALLLYKQQSLDLGDFEIYIDGIFICWLEKLFRGRTIPRVSFDYTSGAPIVFKDAVDSEKTVALVGGVQGVANCAGDIIRRDFPGINVVATCSGFFEGDVRAKTIEILRSADIVVCGMGAPHQELFLLDLKSTGWGGSGYTCGGFLDQLCDAGGDYYPVWIDKSNLRWLYRIIKEPRRLLLRYGIDYPRFLWCYLTKKISFNLG